MVYAALLRGINVGGNNKIAMKDLKQTFLRSGMESVVTYINSGNVMFMDEDHTKDQIADILEKAIEEDFGLNIKVLIVSLEDFEELMKVLPTSWKNDKDMKADVIFLWEESSKEDLRELLTIKPDIDTVIFARSAIFWSVSKADVTRSGLQKIVGTALYKKVTIRNVNSVRKIYEIMKDIESQ